MSTFLIVAALIFIGANVYYFFNNQSYKKSSFNHALFLKLFLVLTSTAFGFAVIYYVLSLENVILRVSSPEGPPANDSFLTLLYYSGVNILSIGYGDYVPVGSARFFSLIEAAIGLLLPTAYFMQSMNSSNKDN
ncbi:potassium channel family protein [Bacillus thermotolerans]|uniref:Potassium channel protein n=1 Tax=Bacillus thermotolerans TaxID=1221996 RepID=A0A0F5I5D7_BACTR|nr:potassium channel family protein [Bacillus thermotolerans]KKB38007.1 Potassium channel protein [Bacillus thermotolerans]KKB40668.1 Potassium channel protein [Bacillus thermotolerans]KKB43797.1 Potassium channel protein [Bacillus thermotolerans]